jgi:nucleoside-diphosphate-sugar epimerase
MGFARQIRPKHDNRTRELRRRILGHSVVKVLVTGSEGLVGHFLAPRLESAGFSIARFDLKRSKAEDIRNPHALAAAVADVEGIVHLAAVSRVIWGEQDPENCIATNVTAVRNTLDLVAKSKLRPWLFFTSSREVYGDPDHLPVTEEADLRPLNTYARTKLEGERLVQAARAAGLTANIARLASVYGWAGDHDDRVAPAFAAAAARGGQLRVDGPANTLDFTFVEDVVGGLTSFISTTANGTTLPIIHFASGSGTSLGELAKIAARNARKPVDLVEEEPRSYAVSRFVGEPSRARKLLGWSATMPVEQGMKQLIDQYAAMKQP